MVKSVQGRGASRWREKAVCHSFWHWGYKLLCSRLFLPKAGVYLSGRWVGSKCDCHAAVGPRGCAFSQSTVMRAFYLFLCDSHKSYRQITRARIKRNIRKMKFHSILKNTMLFFFSKNTCLTTKSKFWLSKKIGSGFNVKELLMT